MNYSCSSYLTLVYWDALLGLVTVSFVLWLLLPWVLASCLHHLQDLSQLFCGISNKNFILSSERCFEFVLYFAVVDFLWQTHLNGNFHNIGTFNKFVV